MRFPTRKKGRRALIAATLPLALSCSDPGPWHTPTTTRVLGANVVSIAVGESHEFAVECLNDYGQLIPRAPTEWVVESYYGPDRPGRIAIDWRGTRARVRAVSEGTVFVFAGCGAKKNSPLDFQNWWHDERVAGLRVDVTADIDTAWTIDAVVDTLRLRAPSLEDSTTGVTHLLTARSGVGTLSALAPRTFAWSSDHPDVAVVSADGLVRAAGVGVTTVRVERAERTLAIPVRVDDELPAQMWDIALVDAHWTQGAQDAEQRIPIVRNGRAAAVNVTAFATPNAPAATVTLEVWNAADQIVHSASAPLQPSTDSAPTFAVPSAQFLVPRAVVQVAARWRVARDTAGTADADATNDTWPRAGTAPLNAIVSPPLRLRLVPLRLAGNNNAMLDITPESRVFYDSIPRIRLPIADVTVTVEPPLTVPQRISSATELAADPELEARQYELHLEILEAVDRRRLASGAGREDYWVGVLPQPMPDARSPFGAMAYIPRRASETGPMSRSMIVWGHDWYVSGVSAGQTVAHELGHSFGLRHAPCGDAGFPDPAYPIAGGGVGEWVHWVSAWEHGSATRAATIAPESGDFMGYCPSNFVSPYHTRAIIEWRTFAGASLMMPSAPERVLAVRGLLTSSELIVRTPEIIDAERVAGEGSDVRVELLAADGRVLAQGTARTGTLAESSDTPFVAHIPLAPTWADQVASVRVSSARLNRQIVRPLP